MEEEKLELKLPYYIVRYIDDENRTHLAMIDDSCYLQYIKSRFDVVDIKVVEE